MILFFLVLTFLAKIFNLTLKITIEAFSLNFWNYPGEGETIKKAEPLLFLASAYLSLLRQLYVGEGSGTGRQLATLL